MQKLVISLVGVVGTGKTTLLRRAEQDRYPVINEDYIAVSGTQYDNRLIMSKWSWIAHWFEKVSQFFRDNPGCSFVFVDRNVIEAGMWTSNCLPLYSPIEAALKELECLGYTFININVKCSKEIVLERVAKRLEIEPERKSFNESNPKFVRDLFESYSKHSSFWDYELDSTNEDAEKLYCKLLEYLYKRTQLDSFLP